MNARWADELAVRRSAVREIVHERGCDAAVAYGCRGFAEGFRYLTNFEPLFDVWLVVSADGQLHGFLRGTLQLEDAERASALTWRGEADATAYVGRELRGSHRVGVIGMDRVPAVAVDALPRSVELVDLDPDVSALRRTKSALERETLREAGRIADAALESVLPHLEPGLTENQVSARIACAVQEQNATCTLTPFVLSGNDNATTHRDPSDRAIERGETVMIDFLAAVNGYHADLARTVVVGAEPSAAQRRAWEAVSKAHEAILDVIEPGIPAATLQRTAVAVLEAEGFSHPARVGHGLGLGHSLEWPSLDSEDLLQPGTTFCFEPRVNAPGTGTVKIEDDVLVTDDGFELLTNCVRRLTP